MNYDSADGSFHPGPELDKAIAQDIHLGRLKLGAGGLPSNFLHQHISRRCQEYTEFEFLGTLCVICR